MRRRGICGESKFEAIGFVRPGQHVARGSVHETVPGAVTGSDSGATLRKTEPEVESPPWQELIGAVVASERTLAWVREHGGWPA
jgi:hypothetical protein